MFANKMYYYQRFHWDANPWGYKSGIPDNPINVEHQLVLWGEYEADTTFALECNLQNNYGRYEKVQGLLALSDSKENSGGFYTVPGFHVYMKEWARTHPEQSCRGGNVGCPKKQPFLKHAQKITARKGKCALYIYIYIC